MPLVHTNMERNTKMIRILLLSVLFNSNLATTKCMACDLSKKMRLVHCETQEMPLKFEFLDSAIRIASPVKTEEYRILSSEFMADIITYYCLYNETKLMIIYWRREKFVKIYFWDEITNKSHIFIYSK